jgi:hypothetical protein
MTRKILIFTLFLVTLSHSLYSENKIVNFVYIKVRPCLLYDSLGNFHFSIEEYLNYRPNRKIKIAKGYTFDNNNSTYDLDHFFEVYHASRLRRLLTFTLSLHSYDSSYVSGGEGSYSILIYKLPQGVKTIVFHEGKLPKDLKVLVKYIRFLIKSRKIVKVDSFEIDKSVNNFEKQLFKMHVPPRVEIE